MRDRNRLRTTESPNGQKVATWRLVGHDCHIINFHDRADTSPTHLWPGGTTLPAYEPGYVILDGPLSLWEARDQFHVHTDLWDAVREDFWAALLTVTDLPMEA